MNKMQLPDNYGGGLLCNNVGCPNNVICEQYRDHYWLTSLKWSAVWVGTKPPSIGMIVDYALTGMADTITLPTKFIKSIDNHHSRIGQDIESAISDLRYHGMAELAIKYTEQYHRIVKKAYNTLDDLYGALMGLQSQISADLL